MDTIEEPKQIPIFKAPPQTDRKTIAINKEQRIARPNLIPDEISKNEFLNSLIASSLPRNYNFEIHKTIWKIQQNNSSKILLQFPEGLIRFGTVIIDIMSAYFTSVGQSNIKFIVMGDLTYGACCIDDYLASSMGCDLIVHYAHSCLVPINQLNDNVKYLYIFLDIKFDLEHVIECIKHNFDPTVDNIALASTIQFVMSVHELARQLRQSQFNITLPQSRPLSSGEILGCTAPKLDPTINTIVFICDGRFHLEALMIANPDIKAYRYDPYSRKLTHETYAFNKMFEERLTAIEKSCDVMREGGTFGFVLGTLGRQGSEKVYDRLVEQLKKNTQCKSIKVMMPELIQNTLKEFKSVDVWVQVACPRLSIDWGSFFHSPLLNPYEFSRSIKLLLEGQRKSGIPESYRYPMDFYAKNSCGDHTPNHCCQNNQNCECTRWKVNNKTLKNYEFQLNFSVSDA